ncbi:MAG: hypothetical protein ACOYO0_14300, partial [Sandarakinorhabdus sp.]
WRPRGSYVYPALLICDAASNVSASGGGGSSPGSSGAVICRRVTWLAAGLGFAGSSAIGLTLMAAPGLWMDWFTSDPAVHAAGSLWFRMVGASYGFFGLGLMLYFASQGFGRMQGPLVAGVVRLGITAGGAAWFASLAASLDQVYLAAAAGSVLFGLINAAAVWRARPA